MKSFGSDNHSGISPQIVEAIASANFEHTGGYGHDSYTERAKEIIESTFGKCQQFFVFNGTGANIVALSSITHSYNSIICAKTAHINVDECGAPENFTGCKLVAIDTKDGKLNCDLVMPYLKDFNDQHHNKPAVISISQPTELGTLYTVEEIDALAELAHSHSMKLHIDGARLSNAIAALGCDPKDMVKNVDALSLGGTKNGLMIGEVVLLFGKEENPHAIYHQKRAMQLFSKNRFIAVQFTRYLEDGLWLKNASHANQMASYLKEQLESIPTVEIGYKVETNGVFVNMSWDAIKTLEQSYLFYVWNASIPQIRLMTSFDTTKEEIDNFISDLRSAIK